MISVRKKRCMDTLFSRRPQLLQAAALLLFFLIPVSGSADIRSATASVEVVTAEIMRLQRVDAIAAVRPEQVPGELLETLGEAVMARMVGDEAWHRRMNKLMGGEGSSRLRELHSGLARAYLRRGGDLVCWEHSVMKPGMLSFLGEGAVSTGIAGAFLLVLIATIALVVRWQRR